MPEVDSAHKLASEYLALQADEFDEASSLQSNESAIDTRHRVNGTLFSRSHELEREAAKVAFRAKASQIGDRKASIDTEAKSLGLGQWLRFREMVSPDVYGINEFFKGKRYESHSAARRAIDQAFNFWSEFDIRSFGVSRFDFSTKKQIRSWHEHVRESRLRHLDEILARGL